MPHKPTGILLAAGAGRRFGADKLRFPLPDGTPLAVAAARNLAPACDRMLAVLRPGRDDLAALLKSSGCEIIFCADAADGMGHSLGAGVRASSDAFAWIVALADMPFIQSTTHQALARCLNSGASLVATQFLGRRGHPVGFSAEWYSELASLTGDRGGKAILERHREKLVLCPVDDEGVIRDIDRPEDVAQPLQ